MAQFYGTKPEKIMTLLDYCILQMIFSLCSNRFLILRALNYFLKKQPLKIALYRIKSCYVLFFIIKN